MFGNMRPIATGCECYEMVGGCYMRIG